MSPQGPAGQAIAHLERRTTGYEHVLGSVVELLSFGLDCLAEVIVNPRSLSEIDRWFDEFVDIARPKALQSDVTRFERAGNADRLAERDPLVEGNWLATFEKHIGCRTEWGAFAVVNGIEFVFASVVDEHEPTTADPGTMRLNGIQRELDCDRRIDCVAPVVKYLGPDLARSWIS